MDTALSILLGIGLSAACGFRIFVPLLVMSVAAYSGHLTLTGGFEWIATPTALIAFAIATALEIGAYYIPWLDNLLDSIATPTAVVAGVIVTASAVGDMDPLLKWTLAVIAGGGVAGVVQTASSGLRLASSTTTGGCANPLLATLEFLGAAVMSILAVVAPIAAVALVMALLFLLVRRLVKITAGRRIIEREEDRSGESSTRQST